MPHANLILVVFAFVLAAIGAIWVTAPEPSRYRLLSAAFACYMLSLILAGFNL